MFLLSKQSKKETYFDILDSKECFFDLKSETLAKSKKSPFCKEVSPWFLSKNWPFSHIFFFWPKKSQKETFFHILDRKECFLDLKSEVLKNSKKNWHFAKGLVHGFCQKIDLFLICFFWAKKAREKHFLIFWIEKNAF